MPDHNDPATASIEFQITASQLAARSIREGVPAPQVMLAYMVTATKVAVDHYGLDVAKQLLAELALSVDSLSEHNLIRAS